MLGCLWRAMSLFRLVKILRPPNLAASPGISYKLSCMHRTQRRPCRRSSFPSDISKIRQSQHPLLEMLLFLQFDILCADFFLNKVCPTLVSCWPIHLSHFISELKIKHLYPLIATHIYFNSADPSSLEDACHI